MDETPQANPAPADDNQDGLSAMPASDPAAPVADPAAPAPVPEEPAQPPVDAPAPDAS